MKFDDESSRLRTRDAFVEVIHNLSDFLDASWPYASRTFQLKADGSPVGDLDYAVESYARALVSSTLPTFQFLGEESEFSESSTGSYFIIDPIDGTENYLSGLPIWGTGVALIEKNRLVYSWVAFPEMNLEFSSKLVSSSLQSKRKGFRSPYQQTRITGYSSNSVWSDVGPEMSGEIRVLGCSLLNLTLATRGAIHFKSSQLGARVWDILPPILFALEAGKRVLVNGAEYKGEFLNPHSRFVVEIQTS